MSNYKLLALDLDGTLLDKTSRITKANARAVRLAQQAGVQVALCTGRNLTESRVFNSQLEAPADWIVIANGAAAERLSDGVQPVSYTHLLEEQGYRLLLANTDNRVEKELEYLEVFRSGNVDGVILVATILSAAHKQALGALGCPAVLVGQRMEGCLLYTSRCV